MTDIEVMKPLYLPEGGRAKGYICLAKKANEKLCGRVVKTRASIWRHLLHVHGIIREPKLKFEEQASEHSAARV